MSNTLTPKQREALQAVADGKVCSRNCGTAAFRIFGANPAVVGKLGSMKLVSWTSIIGGEAVLTDRGREILAAQTAAE